MGDTSRPNVGTGPAVGNPPEFGPAQGEIEALRTLSQDELVPDPGGEGEVSVRSLRRRHYEAAGLGAGFVDQFIR